MNEISKNNDNFALYTQIRSILLEARVKAYTAVNFAMVQSYWQIGKLIVEDELGGNIRGEYGKRILQNLSDRLTAEFGAGFDVSNLRKMRNFLILAFGILVVSSIAIAEETTIPETCANGAGTVVVGAVTGHKYCKSNTQMNWWNAISWCDALNRRTFDISDCACSNTTADCLHNCPEMNNVGTMAGWTLTACDKESIYRVGLSSGYRDCQARSKTGVNGSIGLFALCK